MPSIQASALHVALTFVKVKNLFISGCALKLFTSVAQNQVERISVEVKCYEVTQNDEKFGILNIMGLH